MPGYLQCKLLGQISEEEAKRTGSIHKICNDCGSIVWVIPRNLILDAMLLCKPCCDRRKVQAIASGEPVVEVPARPFAELEHRRQYGKG